MKEVEKQALIEHAKSWIADAEAARDDIPFGFDEDTEMELSLIKIALATLTAPPVKLPESFYGVIQDGKVVMLPADDGQWLNKTSVAEAFRALEQRAEAAEAKLETAVRAVDNLNAERNALRVKLAELEEQDPVADVVTWGHPNFPERTCDVNLRVLDLKPSPLFTRPAPAINLAELVPHEGFLEGTSDESMLTWQRGWDACRAEIMRNIEEVKSESK